jgi:hypothetical protein
MESDAAVIPTPVSLLLHGYVYATKKRRIEMLEARVAALEELFERRPG